TCDAGAPICPLNRGKPKNLTAGTQ
ncbi:MAG: hypothetical protein H6Q15_2522, partial [Bacteroidetes bacterium]|nr:hypothetical protein [Bacteroidota bacterium]